MAIIILMVIVIGCALVAVARQRRWLRLRGVAGGLLVSYASLVLLLLLGEGYFRFVYAESDGLPTLALENWKARYWHTNAMGFRDPDWTSREVTGKQVVLLIGDSFTAGWGIPQTADRFGDVMAARLGADYAVINLGLPGSSTVDETKTLQATTFQTPQTVVLQYYLNDIETAALSIGLDPGLNPARDMPAWASESYLGNFLYWRVMSGARPEQRGEQSYWDWLYSMYDNSTVWDIHQQQLDAFTAAVEATGAHLVVVIFPNMLDPLRSIAYADRVAQYFAAHGYADSTLKLFDAAAAMPLAERVVSVRDAHASAAFNRQVGEWLAPLVVQPALDAE